MVKLCKSNGVTQIKNNIILQQMRFLQRWIVVAVRGSETHTCAVELAPFPRPCCYVHNSKVNQHTVFENNVVEAADLIFIVIITIIIIIFSRFIIAALYHHHRSVSLREHPVYS